MKNTLHFLALKLQSARRRPSKGSAWRAAARNSSLERDPSSRVSGDTLSARGARRRAGRNIERATDACNNRSLDGMVCQKQALPNYDWPVVQVKERQLRYGVSLHQTYPAWLRGPASVARGIEKAAQLNFDSMPNGS